MLVDVGEVHLGKSYKFQYQYTKENDSLIDLDLDGINTKLSIYPLKAINIYVIFSSYLR